MTRFQRIGFEVSAALFDETFADEAGFVAVPIEIMEGSLQETLRDNEVVPDLPRAIDSFANNREFGGIVAISGSDGEEREIGMRN